MHLEI